MDLDTKIPPPPRVPKGLIALASAPRPSPSQAPSLGQRTASTEPEEQTRHWRPSRALLEPSSATESASAPEVVSAGFARAADEQTMIGRANLTDPRLFRSEPPPPLLVAELASGVHEATTIEFVGSLAGFDGPAPERPSPWVSSEEKTTLYKPQRAHLSAEEATEEFDLEAALEQSLAGPSPRKVIVAPAVLAGLPVDPARTEATKKRRGRRRVGAKLSVALCLLGTFALLLSAAWRYRKVVPAAHAVLVRLAAVASDHQAR